MNEPREIMLLSKARQAISEATTLDEVKDIRDKAVAVAAYVKKAQMGQGLVVEAAAIKLRAERRLGELLQTLDLADSSRGNQYTGKTAPTDSNDGPILLRDLGLTKSDSSRSQRLASLSDDTFEQYLAEHVSAQREPTMAGLLRLTKTLATNAESDNGNSKSNRHSCLASLLEAKLRFPTIYADPPWPDEDCSVAEWQQTVDSIATEPIARLCEANAHLHLWATTASLPFAFKIIKAWGFTYRSCLVCLDAVIRGTNYWRDAQQFLMFATRGDLPFSGEPQPGWMELDWPMDGSKPDAIYELIEQVSPGPYLDVFGTAGHRNPDWHGSHTVSHEHHNHSGETHVTEKTRS
jgi:N6-adenosine-specific RNA methylase IME4